MHETDIKKFVQLIAQEETASPTVVRQVVLDLVEKYRDIETPTRKEYLRAKSVLRQRIKEMQEQVMPLVGEMLQMRIDRIMPGGSAEGKTEQGVRIVLPKGDQYRSHRTRQTIPAIVTAVKPDKNLVIVSELFDSLVTYLFAESAGRDMRIRSIARMPGVGTLISVTGNHLDDAKMAEVELRMTVTLREDVRLVPWSDDRTELLRAALPHEVEISRVVVQGHNATVYAENIHDVIGPKGCHVTLAARFTGLHIQVRKFSTSAEAVGVGEVKRSAAG